MEQPNRPVHSFRYGNVSAAIWKSPEGFTRTTLVRVYKDGDTWGEIPAEAIAGQSAAAVAAAPDGSLWVATYAEGAPEMTLAHWQRGEWTTVEGPDTPLFPSLAVAPENTLWVALSWESPEEPSAGLPGLAVFDGQEWSEYPAGSDHDPALPGSPYDLIADGISVWVTGPYSDFAVLTPG